MNLMRLMNHVEYHHDNAIVIEYSEEPGNPEPKSSTCAREQKHKDCFILICLCTAQSPH